jgi:hypothetical protein
MDERLSHCLSNGENGAGTLSQRRTLCRMRKSADGFSVENPRKGAARRSCTRFTLRLCRKPETKNRK